MNIEEHLRSVLAREPAPPNFASNVLAKASRRPKYAWIRTIAAALILAAVLPPAVSRYRERARGMEAERELMTALAITRAKLLQVTEKVRRNTSRTL